MRYLKLSFRQSKHDGHFSLNEDPRCPECEAYLVQTNEPALDEKLPRWEFVHPPCNEGCSLDCEEFYSKPTKSDLRY